MTTEFFAPSSSSTAQGCGRPDCTATEPVDLFCRTHGALLVFSSLSQRVRYFLGVLACALAWAAFYTAPALNNVVPIVTVLAVAGLAVVFLPLRHFPVAGRSIAAGWLVACALAPVLIRPHSGAFETIVAVLALVLASGWVVRLARSAATVNKMSDSSGGLPGTALIATCLGLAAAAGLLWLATLTPAADREVHLPAGLSTPLAWAVWIALGLAVLGLTGISALSGSYGWSDRAEWLIQPPRRPRRLTQLGKAPRLQSQGRHTVDRFIDGLSRVTVQLVLSVVDILIYLLYFRLIGILVGIANWLLLWLMMMFLIARRSIKVLVRSAWSATRVIIVPAASLLLAALLIFLFAYADVHYVRSGSPSNIALLVGYAAGAYAALTLAWTALSAMPPDRFYTAVIDMTGPTLAITIVLTLIGGWGFGIAGLAGYGPFHIGWLTGGCTLLVTAVLVTRGLRRRSLPIGSDETLLPAQRTPPNDQESGIPHSTKFAAGDATESHS